MRLSHPQKKKKRRAFLPVCLKASKEKGRADSGIRFSAE
jgi:hypothetical protein